MHHQKFKQQCNEEIKLMAKAERLRSNSIQWLNDAGEFKYSYHFEWMGRPIIQFPQDIMAMQEIIFEVKPDLIIETGVAHGGSLILYSSLLELNTLCGGPKNAHVLGIDIDIREHNRVEIEKHPLFKRISLFQGSSVDKKTIAFVKKMAAEYKRIMLVLDSNHTHEHVLTELEAYASLVSLNSYCVVFDTVIEYTPENYFPDRPWGKGNNPMTALDAYLKNHPEFEIDAMMDAKLQISVAPRGYLKRV